MALTTGDSAKSPEPKKSSDPVKPAGPKAANLARAGESSSQAVQQLLAQRQTAVMNDDQDAIAAIDETLREEHGVSAA